jgi:prephenate dehydrogenase
MQLLVVGAGEMGRWFARRSGAGAVAFADRDPATAREAAATMDVARVVPLDTDETFDVVCLAVPMSSVPAAIETHAGKATGAVVDVAGEMRDSVAALEAHAEPRGRACASFHPLFSAANAPGNVPVVVVRDGPAIGRIRSSLEAAGNEVFETTAEEHDRAMETVQAKAHTAVLAYALVAEEVDPRFHTALSEPLSELVTGLTGDTPAVYAEIQARFDGSESVAEAAASIAAADGESFVELYEEAGE